MQFSTQHGSPRPPGTTSATRSEAFGSAEQGFVGERSGPQPSAVAAWPTGRLEAGGRRKGSWRAPDRGGWRTELTDRQRYTLKIRRQRHELSARARERERVHALQKFRNLHRVPLREDDLALPVHHDIGAPTDTLSCEAYGVLDSATLPEAVEEPIRSARS